MVESVYGFGDNSSPSPTPAPPQGEGASNFSTPPLREGPGWVRAQGDVKAGGHRSKADYLA